MSSLQTGCFGLCKVITNTLAISKLQITSRIGTVHGWMNQTETKETEEGPCRCMWGEEDRWHKPEKTVWHSDCLRISKSALHIWVLSSLCFKSVASPALHSPTMSKFSQHPRSRSNLVCLWGLHNCCCHPQVNHTSVMENTLGAQRYTSFIVCYYKSEVFYRSREGTFWLLKISPMSSIFFSSCPFNITSWRKLNDHGD